MDNNLFVCIPRDIVLNYTADKRNHRGSKFRTLHFYRNKKKMTFNDYTIQEIDIYNVRDIQTDTFYKSCYKSKNDPYYDWYYCLKEKFNDCNPIYIQNEISGSAYKKIEDGYVNNRLKRKIEPAVYRNKYNKPIEVLFD